MLLFSMKKKKKKRKSSTTPPSRTKNKANYLNTNSCAFSLMQPIFPSEQYIITQVQLDSSALTLQLCPVGHELQYQ